MLGRLLGLADLREGEPLRDPNDERSVRDGADQRGEALRFTNGVYFGVSGSSLQVLETHFEGDTVDATTIATVPLAFGDWVDLDLLVDRSASPATATAALNGNKLLAAQPLALTYTPGTVEVTGGADYAETGSLLLMDFDDVRVDIVP